MENTKIAYTITVSGVVQGVGFRYFTKQKAETLRLKGAVENMPCGTVFISVQGDVESVFQFLTWCHDGPDTATVASLEYNIAEVKNLNTFEIIR